MRTIDPILPRKPLRPGHGLPPTVVAESLRKPKPRKSIDGITAAPTSPPFKTRQPLPQRPLTARTPLNTPHVQPMPIRPVKTGLKLPTRHQLNKRQMIVTVTAAAILIGTALITRQPLGQALIILYGVIAVMKRISSRTTFIFALGAFITTIISLIVIGKPNIISTSLAEYAFLFLIIGTAALGFELHEEN